MPSALSDGLVRDDLYYRIAGATIDVPSLRERVEDIALLAITFWQNWIAMAQAPVDCPMMHWT